MRAKSPCPQSRAPARGASKIALTPKGAKTGPAVKRTKQQSAKPATKACIAPQVRLPVKTMSLAGIPFETAEEAWFWFMAAHAARADGAIPQNGAGAIPRPCEPIDIYNVIDRLYRGRLLQMSHFRVLKFYGERFMRPDVNHPRDRGAARLWAEAMARLAVSFMRRGIITARFASEPRGPRKRGVHHVV